jgi:hypothetical protein
MAGNLFNKAKSTASTKTVNPKDQKVRLTVKDGDFFDKVSQLEKLNDNMKRDKAKADMLSDEIRETSKQKWVELYEKTGRNPGSVMVEAKKGLDTAQTMFIPMDKYISINPDRAQSLIDEYGSDIVEEKTTFSFDNDMIEKYGEVISRLIEESDEIDDDDKGQIIKAVQAFSIAKGTIDQLKNFGKVSTMMEVVKPVVSLKNVEVIKG